jgi:two-component system nitrate/nitrite sensor histidine kinase NarX
LKKNPYPPLIESSESDLRTIYDTAPDGLIITEVETGLILEANQTACKMHGYNRQEFISKPLTSIIESGSLKLFNEKIDYLKSRHEFKSRLKHISRDKNVFFAEWHGVPITYNNKGCMLSIIRDVTNQILEENIIREHLLELSYLEQSKLLEISQTLASTLEFNPDLILDQIHEIIDYDHAGLFMMVNSSLVTLAMSGDPKFKKLNPFKVHVKGTETLAFLFNDHRPIIIADIWADHPQAKFLRTLLDDGAAQLLIGMKSWMWIPLAVKNRIIGGLGMGHKEEDFFTLHHADLALSAANQAAITMANMELYEQAKKLAIYEERQRLARNLHDAVNQSLFSAGLIAEVLPRLWEQDPEEARESIIDLLHLTRGAQAEMRSLLAELRPSTLIDSDLKDLLTLLGNAYTGRTNIPVKVSAMKDIILPSEVQIVFYRICQEALFNVAKHAKAQNVEIVLHQNGRTTELNVRDDGKGFSYEDHISKTSGHYGLTMMKEHAESVRANLSIKSQPGAGTELTLSWTYPKNGDIQ